MIIEEYQKKRDTNNLEEFFAGIENRLACKQVFFFILAHHDSDHCFMHKVSSLDEKSRFITCLLNDLQEKNWDETSKKSNRRFTYNSNSSFTITKSSSKSTVYYPYSRSRYSRIRSHIYQGGRKKV